MWQREGPAKIHLEGICARIGRVQPFAVDQWTAIPVWRYSVTLSRTVDSITPDLLLSGTAGPRKEAREEDRRSYASGTGGGVIPTWVVLIG